MATNPRILDVQNRVIELWQERGMPYHYSVARVAEILDMSVSVVEDCVSYDPRHENETFPNLPGAYVDPFSGEWEDSEYGFIALELLPVLIIALGFVLYLLT